MPCRHVSPSRDARRLPAALCVGARRMVELLKELPEQGITIEVNDDTLENADHTYQGGHFIHSKWSSGAQYPQFEPETSGEPAVFTIATEQMVSGPWTIRCLPPPPKSTVRQ